MVVPASAPRGRRPRARAQISINSVKGHICLAAPSTLAHTRALAAPHEVKATRKAGWTRLFPGLFVASGFHDLCSRSSRPVQITASRSLSCSAIWPSIHVVCCQSISVLARIPLARRSCRKTVGGDQFQTAKIHRSRRVELSAWTRWCR